jgi:hypothetical protein
LGTWSVYVFDRLLDARKAFRSGDRRALRERHFFHWRHRRALLPAAAATALVAAGMVIAWMPAVARVRNSVLAVAALAYFSGVHWPRPRQQWAVRWTARLLSKEFLVGVLFTAGCALPALSRSYGSNKAEACFWPLLVATGFFAGLAWLNCYAIEAWEADHGSGAGVLAIFLCLAGLVVAFFMELVSPRASALLCAGSVSALLLAMLDRVRRRLTPLALRAASDLVLLTPLVLLVQ